MKFIHLVGICILMSVLVRGQSYQPFPADSVTYFRMGLVQDVYPPGWFYRYSDSPIKAARIDSVMVQGADRLLFPFRTWRDTATLFMTDCGLRDGPGWMGDHILESINGDVFLFSINNDTVLIRSQANYLDTWTFMRFQGGYVQATMDSLFMLNVNGTSDTIKQIRLSVFDTAGQPLPLHALQQRILWLSSQHGFVKCLSFRELPGYVELVRTDSPAPLTWHSLYDFDIGDQFEYENVSSSYPPSFVLRRILDKWFNSSMDSVYYVRQNNGLYFQFNPSPSPHLDSIFTSTVDTVSYPASMQAVYTAVPEQNTEQQFARWPDYGLYLLKRDTSLYHNRPVYTETSGFYSDADTAIWFNHFEPVFYTTEVSPGLGVTVIESDEQSITGPVLRNFLIWYQKNNGETWGSFVNLFTPVTEQPNYRPVAIYPNPAASWLVIACDPTDFTEAVLYSREGKECRRQRITGYTQRMELDGVDGVGVLELNGPKGKITKRIVVLPH